MKYWELIAYNLAYAGWSWSYTSHLTARGETIFCIDARRDDEKLYVVHSDDLFAGFREMERIPREIYFDMSSPDISKAESE